MLLAERARADVDRASLGVPGAQHADEETNMIDRTIKPAFEYDEAVKCLHKAMSHMRRASRNSDEGLMIEIDRLTETDRKTTITIMQMTSRMNRVDDGLREILRTKGLDRKIRKRIRELLEWTDSELGHG